MIRQALLWGCGLIILLMSGPPCRAQATDRDFTGISAKLFPAARDWTCVSQMKHASATYLRENESKLKTAYAAAVKKSGLESEYCSFIERAFADKYGFPQGFYIHDLNADGLPDVMYTGGAECGEGNATVVWYGATKGFIVKQPEIENSMVLRVKEGKTPRMCTVAVACCAGQTDEYFLGNFLDTGLDIEKSLVVDIKTGMPVKTENMPLPFVGEANEMILRSSPARDNSYNKAMSGLMRAPVYGNILSKYRSGCKGEVLARKGDGKANLWYFVALDKTCRARATYDPFKANVGWVEARGITMTPWGLVWPDYERISALLFPETKSWTAVSKMKPASEAFLRANEAKMRDAYRASGIADNSREGDMCFGRLFSTEPPYGFPGGFHLHDVDRDGRTDIIYAGQNPCGEGNITIVWYAKPDKYVVRPTTLGNVLALRLREGPAPRMSFVSRGCCGDFKDVYGVGAFPEPEVFGGRTVMNYTQLAPLDKRPVPFAAGDTGFVLRSSSAIDNAYLKYSEEMEGFRVFGNVTGKYPAGCTGKVIGRLTDADGRLWYFVTLDGGCESLRAPAGYDADAGWVEAASVSIKRR
jgi:hypothetical protein